MTEGRQPRSSESRVDELVRDLYTKALEFDWRLEADDIVGSSRQPRTKRARRRVGVALVAAAILMVFFVPFPHLSVFDRLGHHPGAISTSRPKTPVCKIGQLSVTYYGGSGAAGTAITAFKVTNSSKVACALTGYPTVQFFTGATDAPRAFAVDVSHDGPGVAFASHPRSIVLGPSSSAGSAGKSAGLLFTSGDFASNGSGNCPQVTSIVVRLHDSGQGKRVFLWYPSNVCRRPASANVSAFFPASSLGSYTLPVISPVCEMSDLSVTAGRDDAGVGHVGLAILFRNVSVIPCRTRYYPSVSLLDASGRRVATATDTPSGYLGGLPQGTSESPLVNLVPGQTASALIEGLDSTSSGAACPVYGTISVIPPLLGKAVRIEHAFSGCSDLDVHPVVPGTTGSFSEPARHAKSTVSVVARIPPGFRFASPPVLVPTGHEVVTLLEPGSGMGGPMRLAQIKVASGRVLLGPVVAGRTAGVFTGPTGQVFLLTLSGGTVGHFELSRLPSDLTPVPLLRLPFTERTAIKDAYTDPAIAVAVVPKSDEAWIGDGAHIELVNLADGDLISSISAPRDIEGNVMGLAVASADGPLFALFCGRRSPNPNPCGDVAEINSRNGLMIAQRWFGGLPWFPASGIVATPAGAWVSITEGLNGKWMDFLSAAGLHPTQLSGALGWLDLFGSGDVVWGVMGSSGISCASASVGGVPRQTVTYFPLMEAGYLFGIETQGGDVLLVAAINLSSNTVLAVRMPRACASGTG